MKYLILGASALALSACAVGINADNCANAQKAMALAEAAVVAFPGNVEMANALAQAKAALPLFCPAPVTIVVPAE
jgi:hypothetical protein